MSLPRLRLTTPGWSSETGRSDAQTRNRSEQKNLGIRDAPCVHCDRCASQCNDALTSCSRNSNDDADREVLDTVVVLGTSREDTTALTSTAPVDVILPEQLQRNGAVTINQALSKLHPSFNFPQGQNAVKGQGVRAASLRGVGPGYTLVLVNGKRRNVSSQLSGTDPWPATQVVDINVIPGQRRRAHRGPARRRSRAVRLRCDRWCHQHRAEGHRLCLGCRPARRRIHRRRWPQLPGDGHDGPQSRRAWFLNISVDRLKNDQVDRSEADWRQLFPNGDPRNETFNKKYGLWGQSARDQWTALINAGYEVSDPSRAYGWAELCGQGGENFVNPERVVKAKTQSPTATNGTVYRRLRCSVFILTSISRHHLRSARLRPEPPVSSSMIRRSVASIWPCPTDRTKPTAQRIDSINPSYGPASPTSFYLGSWKSRTTSGTIDYIRDLPIAVVDTAVLSAGSLYRHEYWGTGDFGDEVGYTSGPLGGRTIASLYGPGGIYNQYAALFPGVNFATDTSASLQRVRSPPVLQPIDAGSVTRDVYGGYVGVDAGITDKLDVGLTARYENYSDFGDTSNYRVTARYEFVPGFAVRGTVSSGFHAPSLAQLGQQTTGYTSTFTNNGSSVLQPGRTRLFRSADPTAAAFGAKPLQPENRPPTRSVSSSDSIRQHQFAHDRRLSLADPGLITNTDPIQGPSVIAAFNAASLDRIHAGVLLPERVGCAHGRHRHCRTQAIRCARRERSISRPPPVSSKRK